jgi:hypothetical protein
MVEVSKLDWLAAFIKQVTATQSRPEQTTTTLLTRTSASKYNFRCIAMATLQFGTKLGLSH